MIVRVVLLATFAIALAVGGTIFWLQEYAYYREVSADGVEFTLRDGTREVLPAEGFRGIDSDSSPIRYRACFSIPPERVADLAPFPLAEPLNPPRWFDCFDPRAIDQDIEAGAAQAVLGGPVVEGIVRVAAVYPDGRAFAWHQIDPCGPLAEERPAACPEAPAEPAAEPPAPSGTP